eukprot:9186176-Pyramimonas_sp.AAC.2
MIGLGRVVPLLGAQAARSVRGAQEAPERRRDGALPLIGIRVLPRHVAPLAVGVGQASPGPSRLLAAKPASLMLADIRALLLEAGGALFQAVLFGRPQLPDRVLRRLRQQGLDAPEIMNGPNVVPELA